MNQLLSMCSLDLYEFDLYEGFLERIIRINRGMSVLQITASINTEFPFRSDFGNQM